jgi:hypothetical protein
VSEQDPNRAMRQPDAGLPALRASDADRERTAELLRSAAGDGRLDADELEQRLAEAFRARTVVALQTLTADLQPASVPGPEVTAAAGPSRSSIVSIMGGAERKGRWRVAQRLNVLNIMGGSELDLTAAELSGPMTEIRVLCIMGGCELRLPHGVEVRISKLGIMGGHDVQLDREPPPPGAPVIHLRMVSIMGGAEVRQGPKPLRTSRRERKLDRG